MTEISQGNPLRGRRGGVLLHVTSLPGAGAIGDLGPAGQRWLDWLAEAGCGAWQILPLGPPGYGHSPYQSLSSFAGSPLLISPERMVHDGLLAPDSVAVDGGEHGDRVDFEAAARRRSDLLAQAFAAFEGGAGGQLRRGFEAFKRANSRWLDEYALFVVLKEVHDGAAWYQWPEPLRRRQPSALDEFAAPRERPLERVRFTQFLFQRQWDALRARARANGILLIGDLPIYVALDSADVWAHQEYFQLAESGRPQVVAGVPPDYFSERGQRWGNPLYRWQRLEADGYRWWIDRVARSLEWVDLLRLDHFRGFEAYWEIPAGAPDARRGRWVQGPGAGLLQAMQEALGGLPLIAEDLGVITLQVEQLRDQFGLPGMKVLQFAFSGESSNPYLPHNYGRNCAVYTGTHDNDTSRGWYESAGEAERDQCRRYLGVGGGDIAWDLIRAAWRSVADLSLAPMQDMLELGSEARMNVPGRPQGNWGWRAPQGAMSSGLAQRLRELNELYGRSGG